MLYSKKIKNLIYRLKWHYSKHLPLRKPVCVDLELSSVCNLKCDFCYHASTPPFYKGYMSGSMAAEIIDEARKLKIPSIKLNYRGEPLLHKDFADIVDYAKRSGIHDRIVNTNLNTKDMSKIDALLDCTTIKVSLDTLDISKYKKIRKGGNFKQVIKNLGILHDKITDQMLILQFVKSDLNFDECFDRAHCVWPKAEIVVKDVVGGRNEKTKCPEGDRKACVQAFARIMVLFNGDMQLCCPDISHMVHLGNFKYVTLEQAFNCDNARKIRRNLKNGKAFKMFPCKFCSSYESYDGWKGRWNS